MTPLPESHELASVAAYWKRYERMRARGPADHVQMPGGLSFVRISRYAEARETLIDERFSTDVDQASDALQRAGLSIGDLSERSPLRTDLVQHARLRRFISRSFGHEVVHGVRDDAERIIRCLMDELSGRAEIEVLGDVATPLQVQLTPLIAGFPRQEHARVMEAVSGLMEAAASPALHRRQAASRQAVGECVDRAVRTAIEQAGVTVEHEHTLIGGLVGLHAEDAGDLTVDEVVQLARLMVTAGHSGLTGLIVNSVLALLQHPGQLEQLRGDPALLNRALEELIRHSSPVHRATYRVLTEDVVVGGVACPTGSLVTIQLSAANHDPRRFDDADALRFTRQRNLHLSFGHGAHYCPAANLSRMVVRTVLAALLERLSSFELAVEEAELEWVPSGVQWGVARLPLRVDWTDRGR